MAPSDTVVTISKVPIHMFDVSGLKHHRKKWLSYFDIVHTILFVVSLSSYDQTMIEDPTVNRMVDSLVLFEDICNNELLAKLDIILFLNKVDLFKKKVKVIPVKKFFPEYSGELELK
jgi:guanine nucleotide-binding protein subunit alpha